MPGDRQGPLQGTEGTVEGSWQVHSVQHGIQLVSQGIEHGADVIQNVLGGGARGPLSLLSTNALDRKSVV